MDTAAGRSPVLEFGRFTLDRYRREFLADGRAVPLGGRAFDILLHLIDARGAVVAKDDLMHRIWSDRVVEENNVEIQISALRKALGPDRGLIRTVSRRGYQFTADVDSPAPVKVGTASPDRITNLPASVSELIGREPEIRDVIGLVERHRLVTLTGVGGTGKTRLGLEVASRLVSAFADGVFLADLAPVFAPDLVPITVAAALNLPLVADGVSAERIGAALGTKRLLLVLDNCEHLLDAAARIAQAVLSQSPGVSVLTTSREVLRADGEHVYRVPPLALPPDDAATEDILRHDAVQLFVTRAVAAEPLFAPDSRIAATVAVICRRLDGMPLAIELAAARVPSLGVAGIAARLDDRFALLTSGTRTALPRHQTLRATLDWSYDLLSERERVTLRRLAVFAGSFVLDAAIEVAAGLGLSAVDISDALGNLVTKSLVSTEIRGSTHYRLLETTRAYAVAKLIATGEFDRFARRHAGYYGAVCARFERWETSPPSDWMAVYGRQIENIRLALDWAFSPTGDVAVGVSLTAAAVPLWTHLSLMTETRARVEQAIAHLGPEVPVNPRRDMQLFLGLGMAMLHTGGVGSTTMVDALTKALELAESLEDHDYRLRAMYALYVYRLVTGDYRGALALAESMRTAAATIAGPTEALVAGKFLGTIVHLLGDQPGARRHIERLVNDDVTIKHHSHTIRYQWDQRVTTHSMYARILWLQGFTDQAVRIADDIVEYARTTGHAPSSYYALSQAACPLAVCAGDLNAADRYVKLLLDLGVKHAHDPWSVTGHCYGGIILIRRGKSADGSEVLGSALERLPEAAFHIHTNLLRSELAEGLAATGHIGRALSMMDDALARAERTEEGWYLPELLRKKGELLLMRGAPIAAAADAERCFHEALDVARRQGALSWELRAATSLARLYQRQAKATKARKILAPVYRRFSEGFESADLVAANALLHALR